MTCKYKNKQNNPEKDWFYKGLGYFLCLDPLATATRPVTKSESGCYHVANTSTPGFLEGKNLKEAGLCAAKHWFKMYSDFADLTDTPNSKCQSTELARTHNRQKILNKCQIICIIKKEEKRKTI